MAGKPRKLADLYSRGEKVTLDDGSGPVSVWMQKLNPVEHETAVRKANSARATILALRKTQRDEQSEEYLNALNDVIDLDHDDLVDYVAADELSKRMGPIQAEYADSEGWLKEGYLQGLQEAWATGLEDNFASDEPSDEAKHVKAELDRFEAGSAKALEDERLNIVAQYDTMDDDRLREIVIESVLKLKADIAWLVEFRKCQVWLGTRYPDDHKKPYFDTRTEVDMLASEVLNPLIEAAAEMSVESEEGKDLPGDQSSSESSGLPEKPETAASSGL